MKAQYQHLGLDEAKVHIKCFQVKSSHFGFHWHYHPEYEITYVLHGRGTRLIGDNADTFESGDMVFLGSNLPHTWVSDDDFNESDGDMRVQVLQFSPELFQEGFLSMDALFGIRRLFAMGRRGVQFENDINRFALAELNKLVELQGFDQLICLMNLLNTLGQEQAPNLLASPSYAPVLNRVTEERLLRVCQYVHDHFTESIRLEKAAELSNMNQTAFCRFFKKSTGQSFMDYVNDLRVAKACNLLIDPRELSVSEIAFRSGFKSQTLFNRFFMKRKQMTPTEFRKLSKRV